MEKLTLNSTGKEERYIEILPQIKSIVSSESDTIANLANVAAILKEAFGFFWVGFYLVKKAATNTGNGQVSTEYSEEKELVLGPFQGPLACTRIKYGRGVCGSAWKEARTIVVPDVEQFPGHIACSSLSRSEIVVPIFKQIKQETTSNNGNKREVIAVLDIDSKELNTFDRVDSEQLEKLSMILEDFF